MLKYLVPLFATGSLLLVSATTPSIGLVKSTGEFRVDGSAVRGNGNVFEGNVVETAASRSTIQLADAQITLAPDSRARIYRDHTVLEKGSGSVKEGVHHVIEANSLHIAPASQHSVVQIEITSASRVTVASLGGPADVRNATGILAAHLIPGMSLAFEPQAGTASAVKVTGMLQSRDGLFFLTDETTKVLVQIQGTDLKKSVGKRVVISGNTVAGATPAGGATQVVAVTTVSLVKAGGMAGAAGAGAGAGGGLSHAAIIAIVAGVGVGGTVGGLAAAGTFSSSPSISR